MDACYDYACEPHMAWLTLNHACNMRCVWCYNENTHYQNKAEMSLPLAQELVDIGIDAGAEHFNLIGEELTLWSPLFELIDYCREGGVTTGLITNAAKFADDQFWKEYQNHPCDQISISVKAVESNIFQKATGTKIYGKTMLGIQRAIEFHQTGVTTVFNSLIGLDGLKSIAKTCREMGASSIIVNMCSPTIDDNGEAKLGYALPLSQLVDNTIGAVEYLEELYNGNVELDIQMPLCLFPTVFVEKHLHAKTIMTLCQVFARSGINFDTEGNVTVCNELANVVVARKGVDFTDGKSLLRHLNSAELRANYQELLKYPSECCTKCRWQDDCRGGCLLNWMIYQPDICRAVA